MATRVEWDITNKVALRVMEDHWNSPQATGTTRAPEAVTEWRDIQEDYPVGYLPQYPELMGNEARFYEDDAGVVHREWVNSDFSEDAVRSSVTGRVVQEARRILAATDHLVVEAMEKGEPVSPDVTALREAIRARRDQDTLALVSAPIAQVIDHLPDFTDLAHEVQVKNLTHDWPDAGPQPRPPPRPTPQATPPPPGA